MNSCYQQQPEVDPENSEKGGWDTCPLAGYIETFYCSENSIKIIYKIISRKKGPLWPTPKSTLTVASCYSSFVTEKKLIGA